MASANTPPIPAPIEVSKFPTILTGFLGSGG